MSKRYPNTHDELVTLTPHKKGKKQPSVQCKECGAILTASTTQPWSKYIRRTTEVNYFRGDDRVKILCEPCGAPVAMIATPEATHEPDSEHTKTPAEEASR